MSNRAELSLASAKMKEHGFQSWISRKTNISRTTVCEIFSGRRQCTPAQAAAFEALFVQKGIPLNRWDLLYGYTVNRKNPVPLADYLTNKATNEQDA